jgi:molybdate transport system regulatory protein
MQDLDHAKCMAKLTIRVDFDTGESIGPGKIRLLEEIEKTGSIRKAAEAVGMSFRQAWLLLRAIEEMFGQPVIVTLRGGIRGGGSALTPLGRLSVTSYRQLEQAAGAAALADIAALEANIKRGDHGRAPARSRISRKPLKNKR